MSALSKAVGVVFEALAWTAIIYAVIGGTLGVAWLFLGPFW
jgi:hypothetical protein